MADVPKRGAQDELLPNNAVVLRASKPPLLIEEGQVITRSAFDFELSSSDKEMDVPKLSVFVQGLTTDEQACSLVGDGVSRRLIARLLVADIHAISNGKELLQVVWDDPFLSDMITPDTRPGAEGHAGILGLKKPPHVPKAEFKKVQIRLADAVGDNFVILPLKHTSTLPAEEGHLTNPNMLKFEEASCAVCGSRFGIWADTLKGRCAKCGQTFPPEFLWVQEAVVKGQKKQNDATHQAALEHLFTRVQPVLQEFVEQKRTAKESVERPQLIKHLRRTTGYAFTDCRDLVDKFLSL